MTTPRATWVLEDRRSARAQARIRLALCVLSGVLLGAAFPPSTLGMLACAGLVPLLVVLADVESIGTGLRYTYLAMLVFHLITLNWTGGYAHAEDGYMMIAGAVTMVVHPLFYLLPMGAYLVIRRRLGVWPALLSLPFVWVAYEYSHALTEWSFPWLTLGNTQTYDPARVQMVSITGVYGLSFWIVCVNVLLTALYTVLAQRTTREFPPVAWRLAGAVVLVSGMPWLFGVIVLSGATVDGEHPSMDRGTVTVGMIQPNTNPWEKWSGRGGTLLNEYLGMTDSLVRDASRPRPAIVLWPETSVPFFLLTKVNRPWRVEMQTHLRWWQASLVAGLPHIVEYPDSTLAPPSAKRSPLSGERYDTFNAVGFFQPGADSVPWYGKMKMVPLAERIPYADMIAGLDVLRWNVGIGGWQIGPGQKVFVDSATGTTFATAICYESVYPDFIAEFVRRGAEVLTIVTVDSWWDHMAGAYQHERYAVLRAVENRRWIARCALGGISCYVDPYGRVYDATPLFTRGDLSRTIGRSAALSCYTAHGDVFALFCVWGAGAFLVAAAGKGFMMAIRKRQWDSP